MTLTLVSADKCWVHTACVGRQEEFTEQVTTEPWDMYGAGDSGQQEDFTGQEKHALQVADKNSSHCRWRTTKEVHTAGG